MTADSGGRAVARLAPIEGAEQVARACVEIAHAAPEMTILERTVNGQPGLVAQLDGSTVTVYAFPRRRRPDHAHLGGPQPDKLRPWGS